VHRSARQFSRYQFGGTIVRGDADQLPWPATDGALWLVSNRLLHVAGIAIGT
jgi:hypothetical protein